MLGGCCSQGVRKDAQVGVDIFMGHDIVIARGNMYQSSDQAVHASEQRFCNAKAPSPPDH